MSARLDDNREPPPPQAAPLPRPPTLSQKFFARNGPLWLWCAGVTLGVVLLAIDLGEISTGLLIRWPGALWAVGGFALAMLVGPCIAVASAPLLGPLYHWREWANGGPFLFGDAVQVIAGPHAGRVGKIYGYFQGDTVRVGLGAEAAADFTDVFSGWQLLLIARENPRHPPTDTGPEAGA